MGAKFYAKGLMLWLHTGITAAMCDLNFRRHMSKRFFLLIIA